MVSTVLFSLTLSPTAAHAAPLSLNTSFWGSMKTTAVSFRSICIALSLFSSGLEEGEKDDNIAEAPIGTIWSSSP
jgi:hypothetical protein